jgi:hypothetical protein
LLLYLVLAKTKLISECVFIRTFSIPGADFTVNLHGGSDDVVCEFGVSHGEIEQRFFTQILKD